MATQTRNPTSDVSFTGTWTGSAGTRFQAVDDHPDSGNPIADGLTHGTTAGEGLMGFSVFTVPAGSTNISVQVIYYDFKNASQACNLRARIRCNDTTGRDAPGGTHNPGNGNGNITLRTDDYGANNPKTGAAWTVDDVNGVGTNGLTAFGVVSTDANPTITVSSILLQVTYTEVVSVNVNVTGSTATSATGDETIMADSNLSATGSQAQSSAGTVTVDTTSPDVEALPTGVSATASTGSVSLSASASLSAQGTGATASSGTLSVSGDSSTASTGDSLQSSAGSVSVSVGGGSGTGRISYGPRMWPGRFIKVR